MRATDVSRRADDHRTASPARATFRLPAAATHRQQGTAKAELATPNARDVAAADSARQKIERDLKTASKQRLVENGASTCRMAQDLSRRRR